MSRIPYPYPVLGNDDDVAGLYRPTMKYSISQDFNELNSTFDLTNNYIKSLINSGKALFTIEVECGSTNYRNSFQTCEEELKIRIPSDELREKVSVRFYICAKQEIEDYLPDDAHASFDGEPSYIEAGEVIALGGSTIFISAKKFDPLRAPMSSIIKLLPPHKKDSEMKIVFDNERIGIKLSKRDYDIYQKVQSTSEPAIHSSIVFAALIEALHEINDSNSNYKDSVWADRIRQMSREQSVNINEPFSAAQKLFGNPIERMLNWREREEQLKEDGAL